MSHRAGVSDPFAELTGDTGDPSVRDCIQCGTCSAVCPLGEWMEYTPRRLIALAQAGLEHEVLESRAIWVCTSCYACTVECPRQVPITDFVYAQRRKAMRAETYPRRFPTPVMAREFVRSVDRWGRSTESWISLALYARTDPAQLLRHAPLALRLLRRGRLSFRRESIREPAQLARMLRALEPAPAAPDGRPAEEAA